MSIARIRKNDTVICTRGNDAGKTGTVLKVSHKEGTAVVQGLNVHKKAVRRSQENPQGGFVEREMPIRLCKLMPFDADKKKGSRVASAVKDGKKARQLKASGKVI